MMDRPKQLAIRCTLGLLFVVCIYGGMVLANRVDGPLALTPIKITEPQDALELQLGYERVVNAQLSFQNQLLRTEKKYKVPAGYNYSLENRQFEPPTQPSPQSSIQSAPQTVPLKPNQ